MYTLGLLTFYDANDMVTVLLCSGTKETSFAALFFERYPLIQRPIALEIGVIATGATKR